MKLWSGVIDTNSGVIKIVRIDAIKISGHLSVSISKGTEDLFETLKRLSSLLKSI
ncbi:hypothetical protein QG37_07589 [Candidozyma auris]|nr:hypothetical protein QG37_07589 [[Candida] auris]